MRCVTGWELRLKEALYESVYNPPSWPAAQVELFIERANKAIEKEFDRTFSYKFRRGPKVNQARLDKFRETFAHFKTNGCVPSKREFREHAGFKSNKAFDDYLKGKKHSWKKVQAALNSE